MPRIHAEAAAVLDAPPGAVYAILAELRNLGSAAQRGIT
jgi:hypothetical protein